MRLLNSYSEIAVCPDCGVDFESGYGCGHGLLLCPACMVDGCPDCRHELEIAEGHL